ncbi:hypothetical protein CCUS01_08715 [Colletotrichum cuscutae]|uniref:Uncharacterized protein n=1 Tax=Colletotrichum cuscutae TaxID=1209917 RepID=A0AAI9UPU2_9PEZI|nr:hypothetical protein CCUS01_08715 [Colletotrichum cuscutae]
MIPKEFAEPLLWATLRDLGYENGYHLLFLLVTFEAIELWSLPKREAWPGAKCIFANLFFFFFPLQVEAKMKGKGNGRFTCGSRLAYEHREKRPYRQGEAFFLHHLQPGRGPVEDHQEFLARSFLPLSLAEKVWARGAHLNNLFGSEGGGGAGEGGGGEGGGGWGGGGGGGGGGDGFYSYSFSASPTIGGISPVSMDGSLLTSPPFAPTLFKKLG